MINGGPHLRQWVDDPNAAPYDLGVLAEPDEQAWAEERKEYLLY